MTNPSALKRVGTGSTGKEIYAGTLSNKRGMEVEIINIGASIVAIRVPDRKGKTDNVVLRYDSVTDYEINPGYVGCVIGRYGNRIENARFQLDGKLYKLQANNGPNSLHGGENQPFHREVWDMIEKDDRIILSLSSDDMTDGFPGNMKVKVVYSLNEKNQLRIDYEAVSDKKTVVNLTNHSYFNLTGPGGDPLEHELIIAADRYLAVDENMIPLSEVAEVINTPFDFTKPTKIGLRIDEDHPQLKLGYGYDHTFVVNHYDGSLRLIAEVYDESTGRTMKTYTTEPGVQLYTANFLDIHGENGVKLGKRSGICLETQHFPNSPNREDFPSTILLPGNTFRSTTIYEFSVQG